MTDEFLTVAEVAQRLKINEQTVRNWIDRGELQATRAGRRVRVLNSALDAFLGQPEAQVSPPRAPKRRPVPETRRVTERDIKVIEQLIDTMIVTSAGLAPGSVLQRELAESTGRLQVALRVREGGEDPPPR